MQTLDEPFAGNVILENDINTIITMQYIKSYLDEYDAACLKDVPLITDRFILPRDERYQYISYTGVLKKLRGIKVKKINGYEFVKDAKLSELMDFKFSSKWQNIIKPAPSYSDYRNILLEKRKGEKEKMLIDDVTIGIMVALPIEYAALKCVIGETEKIVNSTRKNGIVYEITKIESMTGQYNGIALIQCGEGNNKSSVIATDMTQFFPNIKLVIMCGIAAGIPSKSRDIRLGDIFIGDKIFQYDYIKDKNGEIEPKAVRDRWGALVENTYNRIEADRIAKKRIWEQIISDNKEYCYANPGPNKDVLYDEKKELIIRSKRADIMPVIYKGTIASGNTVVKNINVRNILSQKIDAGAIEMEGSGLVDAVRNAGIDFCVIRGICDYGDENKNDEWHGYAAFVAAAFTYVFIEYVPSLLD